MRRTWRLGEPHKWQARTYRYLWRWRRSRGNNKLKSRKKQPLKLSATSMETLEKSSVKKYCLTTVRRLADTRLLFGGPVSTVEGEGRAWRILRITRLGTGFLFLGDEMESLLVRRRARRFWIEYSNTSDFSVPQWSVLDLRRRCVKGEAGVF